MSSGIGEISHLRDQSNVNEDQRNAIEDLTSRVEALEEKTTNETESEDDSDAPVTTGL